MNINKLKYAFALVVGLPFAAANAQVHTPFTGELSALGQVEQQAGASTSLAVDMPELADVVASVMPSTVFIQVQSERVVDGEKHKVGGVGSGFVIDAEKGYIVTNNHVAGDAEKIKVVIGGDDERNATLVGADQLTDLAVIQVKVTPDKPLQQVAFGDSDAQRLAETVFAVGAPFGLGSTVTSGIISSLHRGVPNANTPFHDFTQTDAAINRGNSGGPLINLKGEVIGVNSEIFSPSEGGGSVGIGFAIPSNWVKKVTQMLINNPDHKIHWGIMGAVIGPIVAEIPENGMPAKSEEDDDSEMSQGVMLYQIGEGSAAQKAGLQPKDIIVAVNGEPAKNLKEFPAQIAAFLSGTVVDITYTRDGHEAHASVTLDERPDPKDVEQESEGPDGSDRAFPPGFLESMPPEKFEKFLANDYRAAMAKMEEMVRELQQKYEETENEVNAEIERRHAAPQVNPQSAQPGGPRFIPQNQLPPEVREFLEQQLRQRQQPGPGPRAPVPAP
jgi:S1-C subfamily serine protease